MPRRFSKPSRIRRCITLDNVAGASWPWGRGRQRNCWSAEGMCCAALRHLFPPAPAAAGYHSLHLLLQPEAAERRVAAGLPSCSWHTSGTGERFRVCITAVWDPGLAVGCEKPEPGNSCLNVILLWDRVMLTEGC